MSLMAGKTRWSRLLIRPLFCIRVESKRRFMVGHRLRRVADLLVRNAAVVISLGIVRLEANGFAEIGDRVRQIAALAVRDSAAVMGICIAWIQPDRFAEVRDS